MPHYESAKGQLQIKLFKNNEGNMSELYFIFTPSRQVSILKNMKTFLLHLFSCKYDILAE